MEKMTYILKSVFQTFAGPSSLARYKQGPDNFPGGGWNGNHNLSISVLYFDLEEYEIPAVAEEHKKDNWTHDQIREEAITRISRRSAVNMKFYMGEIGETDRDDETTIVWTPTETAPGVYELTTKWADKTISMRDLWNRTKNYARRTGKTEAYDPKEEKVQMDMQEKFLRGDIDSYIAPIWHPENVRLVQVMERQADGSVIADQLDIAQAVGRDLTRDEAELLIKNISKISENGVLHESSEYPHLMLQRGFFDKGNIVYLAQRQIQAVDRKRHKEKISLKGFAVREIKVDVQIPRSLVGKVIGAKIKESAVGQEVEKTKRVLDVKPLENFLYHSGETRRVTPLFEKKKIIAKRVDEIIEKGRSALVKLQEKSQEAAIFITQRYRDMRQSLRILSIVPDSRLARVAMPFVLLSLTKEMPKSILSVEKSKKRHKKKEVKKIKRKEKLHIKTTGLKESRVKYIGTEHPLKPQADRKEKRLEKKKIIEAVTIKLLDLNKKLLLKEKLVKVAKEIFIVIPTQTKKEFISWIQRKKETEQKAHVILEKKGIVKPKEKTLWTHVAVLAGELGRLIDLQKPEETTKKKGKIESAYADRAKNGVLKEKRRIKLQEAIVGFSLSWVMLLLLASEPHEGEQKLDKEKKKEEKESSTEKETPWLLLSIIWHMTMIREQGIVQVTGKKQKKKKKNMVHVVTLPWEEPQERGIIYQFDGAFMPS